MDFFISVLRDIGISGPAVIILVLYLQIQKGQIEAKFHKDVEAHDKEIWDALGAHEQEFARKIHKMIYGEDRVLPRFPTREEFGRHCNDNVYNINLLYDVLRNLERHINERLERYEKKS